MAPNMVAYIKRVGGGYVVDWGPGFCCNTAIATKLPELLVLIESVFGEQDARADHDDDDSETTQ